MTRGDQKGCYFTSGKKLTYPQRTDNCCPDEATPRKGRCRDKDGGEGEGNNETMYQVSYVNTYQVRWQPDYRYIYRFSSSSTAVFMYSCQIYTGTWYRCCVGMYLTSDRLSISAWSSKSFKALLVPGIIIDFWSKLMLQGGSRMKNMAYYNYSSCRTDLLGWICAVQMILHIIL